MNEQTDKPQPDSHKDDAAVDARANQQSTGSPPTFSQVTVNVQVNNDGGPESPGDDFARQAEEAPMGLLAEFWDFLKHEKKWWLTPIILVLLALAALVILSPSAAPFIYPLF